MIDKSKRKTIGCNVAIEFEAFTRMMNTWIVNNPTDLTIGWFRQIYGNVNEANSLAFI